MGRPAGVPNRRIIGLEQRLRERFGSGYNGVLRLFEWAEETYQAGNVVDAADMLSKGLKYVYPQLSSVSVDMNEEHTVFVVNLEGVKVPVLAQDPKVLLNDTVEGVLEHEPTIAEKSEG